MLLEAMPQGHTGFPTDYVTGSASALTSFITLTCNFVLEWCDKIKLSNLLGLLAIKYTRRILECGP